jgi:hypothetical protein
MAVTPWLQSGQGPATPAKAATPPGGFSINMCRAPKPLSRQVHLRSCLQPSVPPEPAPVPGTRARLPSARDAPGCIAGTEGGW